MARKHAEQSFVRIAREHNWYTHKYGDVRYCINCKAPQPKTERMPDYATAIVYTYIECKNSDSTGRWNWLKDIGPEGLRKNQRTWMETEGGWLFIELGIGKAPKGRGAYLIPWTKWRDDIEPYLLENNWKSIRFEGKGKRPGASEFLKRYELKWITKAGWNIPDGHVWWAALVNRLHLQLDKLETKLHA